MGRRKLAAFEPTGNAQRQTLRVSKEPIRKQGTGKSAGVSSTFSSLPASTRSALAKDAFVKHQTSAVEAPQAAISTLVAASGNAPLAERTVPLYKYMVDISTGQSIPLSVSLTKPEISPAAPAKESIAKESSAAVEGVSGVFSALTTSSEISLPVPVVPTPVFIKGTGYEPHILDCSATDRTYKEWLRIGGDDSDQVYHEYYWEYYEAQSTKPAALPLFVAERQTLDRLTIELYALRGALNKFAVDNDFKYLDDDHINSISRDLGRVRRLEKKYKAALQRPPYYIIRFDGGQVEVEDDGGDLGDEDGAYWAGDGAYWAGNGAGNEATFKFWSLVSES